MALRHAMGVGHDERGGSAVEFALLTPALLFIFLAMLDIGMATGEQMSMDRALKVASHAAMSDPGELRVMEVFLKSAGKTGTERKDPPTMSIAVSRHCGCPGEDGHLEKTSCESMCGGTGPASTTYELLASKRFDGVLIPAVPLRSMSRVQVR